MPRIKTHEAGEGGWSEWVYPTMTGYRMICCDCGLAHEMEFTALRVIVMDGEAWEGEELPTGDYRVQFRVRRHNRSTAQVRRAMKREAAALRDKVRGTLNEGEG